MLLILPEAVCLKLLELPHSQDSGLCFGPKPALLVNLNHDGDAERCRGYSAGERVDNGSAVEKAGNHAS